MAFRAEDVQAAERDHFVVLRFALLGKLLVDRLPLVGRHLEDFPLVLEKHHRRGGLRAISAHGIRADNRGRRRVGHGELVFQKMIARHLLGIAAEENVRAAARHVGRDGHRAFAAGLRHDARFALVLLGVQHLVGGAGLLQQFRDGLRFFDRDRADQNRLPALVIVADAVRQRVVFLQDAVDDGIKFFLFRAIDHVRIFPANQLAVRWNDRDVEVVNFPKFRRFGFRGTGHAGEFFVHAKVVLKSDCRQRLILSLDLHAFLGFHRLV